MIIRAITPQERVSQVSAYGGLTTCAHCDEVADYIQEDEHGRKPVCSEHREIVVTAVECYYRSHRAHLMQRGVPLQVASNRAVAVAQYVEVRCLRANRGEEVRP